MDIQAIMLSYIIKTAEINPMLSLFSKVLDVRTAFFDANHQELYCFDVKPRSKYCHRMRRDRNHSKFCEGSDLTHLEEVKRTREICIYHCHRQLFEAAIPLVDAHGVYLGALVFGQLRDTCQDEPVHRLMAEANEFRALPQVSLERMKEIANLLKYFSEAMIEKAWLKRCQESWVDALESYISEHLGENLTLDRMAKAIHVSVSFITHNFKAEFHLAPLQYVMQKKLARARQQLAEGGRVYEVAASLGFYDPYHFSRAFRKHFGYSPRLAKSPAK